MSPGASGPPAFTAFELGREPLFLSRLEGHAREGLHGTRRIGGKAVHPFAVVVLLVAGRSRVQHAGTLELRPGTEGAGLAGQALAFVERSALKPMSLSDVAKVAARVGRRKRRRFHLKRGSGATSSAATS